MSADSSAAAPLEFAVLPEFGGWRLDWFLAHHLRDYSRVRLRRLINDSQVSVDNARAKASQHLRPGQRVTVWNLPQPQGPATQAENIPLAILYEDEDLIAVDKPPGMVVHPARGHWQGTLTAALQFHFDQLSTLAGPSRPGIVHRLDRDTSGVIVVAKHDLAHARLAAQFAERTVEKQYFAIVVGRPDRDRDFIDQPIGVHPRQREKMAIRHGDRTSREARSFYEVVRRFDGFATMQIFPRTGRTHQIRVHLAHIGCPVLCDPQYGGRQQLTRGELRRQPDDTTVLLARQALHAQRLSLTHPRTGLKVELAAPLPQDLTMALAEIERWRPL